MWNAARDRHWLGNRTHERDRREEIRSASASTRIIQPTPATERVHGVADVRELWSGSERRSSATIDSRRGRTRPRRPSALGVPVRRCTSSRSVEGHHLRPALTHRPWQRERLQERRAAATRSGPEAVDRPTAVHSRAGGLHEELAGRGRHARAASFASSKSTRCAGCRCRRRRSPTPGCVRCAAFEAATSSQSR
jgi:hypothetical protein